MVILSGATIGLTVGPQKRQLGDTTNTESVLGDSIWAGCSSYPDESYWVLLCTRGDPLQILMPLKGS